MPQIGSLFVNLSMNTAQFTQASHSAAQALLPIEANSRKVQFALTNLGFQINDVVSGLAQGQAPMRIFAQQAGQIVQLFTQGGGFRAVSSAIAGLITPTRVAVGAVAALGAGFAYLMSRASSNSENLRQFNVLLERTGKLAANLDIGAENAQLRRLGISQELANQQRLAIGRSLTINPAANAALQVMGANLGAFRGTGPAAGFNELQTAIGGGSEAIIKLAVDIGALQAQEASELTTMARNTDARKAQEAALIAIQRQLKLLVSQMSGPATEAANTFAGAWDNLVAKITKPLEKPAIDWLNNLAAIAEGKPTPASREFAWNPAWGPMDPDKGLFKGAINLRPALQWMGEIGGTPSAPSVEIARPMFGGGFGPQGNRIGRAVIAGEDATAEIRRLQQLEKIGAIEPGSAQAVAASGALGGTGAAAAAGFGTGVGAGTGTGAGAGLGVSADLRGGFILRRDPQQAKEVADAMARQKEEILAAARAQKLYNVEQEADLAAEAARQRIRAIPGSTPDEQEAAATAAATAARAKFNVELGKENKLAEMRVEGERKTARAMLESEGAAVRVAAAEQARIDTLQKGGDEAKRTQQALAARSAQAELGLAQGTVTDRKEVEAASLRVSLLGESTEEIERQVALLRVRQTIEAAGVPVAKEIVDARIAAVNALQNQNELLARQRRVMDQIREVAGVFENAFSQAFDSIADHTFSLRKTLGSLLRDLGKTLASGAFRRLLGGDDGGGGILGSLVGRIFPSIIGKGVGGTGPFGDNWSAAELGMVPAAATGGRWRVGGYGAIDSQLVTLRASPGEMIEAYPPGQHGGGGGERVLIELQHDEAFARGVADQQIVTRSGTIIDVAVRQSQKSTQRNFANYSAEAQARQM